MDMKKYYSQLIGSKIIGFRFESEEGCLDDFPVFKLQIGGQIVKLSISRDEECNGGGFGCIEVIK